MDGILFDVLVPEIREDYQLPPYLADENIRCSIVKCYSRLKQLNPAFDLEHDEIGRGLLKDAANYDLYHRYEEFWQNYKSDILSWQLSQEVHNESE